MIGDSREIPSRRVEMATARASPKAIPRQVDRARSTTNSPNGDVSDPSPSITKEASASVRTAPVTSLSADSAMIVCVTFARTRRRSKSGMRIAGSVGARTAPISRPASSGRSKATAATAPVTTAVIKTPGIARRPRPSATGRRTREREPEPAVEEDHRDAECQEQLDADRVERQVERIQGIGPEQRSRGDEHDHARNAEEARHELGGEPGARGRSPASR